MWYFWSLGRMADTQVYVVSLAAYQRQTRATIKRREERIIIIIIIINTRDGVRRHGNIDGVVDGREGLLDKDVVEVNNDSASVGHVVPEGSLSEGINDLGRLEYTMRTYQHREEEREETYAFKDGLILIEVTRDKGTFIDNNGGLRGSIIRGLNQFEVLKGINIGKGEVCGKSVLQDVLLLCCVISALLIIIVVTNVKHNS